MSVYIWEVFDIIKNAKASEIMTTLICSIIKSKNIL